MDSILRHLRRRRNLRGTAGADASTQEATGSGPQRNLMAASPQSIQEPLTSSSSQNENEEDMAGSLGAVEGPTSCQISQEDLFPGGQIYGLRVLHEPAEPLADIIFVHGLTGNSFGTWWEAKSGIYWPIQLFSKDVPNTRIMAFGYDADVTKFLGPVGQNNIRDHASNLLGDLAARRAEDNSVSSSFYCALWYQPLTSHSRMIER
jgi:hypothetical protein